MTTLFMGFVGLVLLPALILSLILNRWVNHSADYVTREDNFKFTITPDTQ